MGQGDEPDGEPLTPTEDALAAISGRILRAGPVRRVHDFFDLGGHSLTALRVVSQVRDAFGVELPLKTVFDARTLGDLAGRIDLALLEASVRAAYASNRSDPAARGCSTLVLARADVVDPVARPCGHCVQYCSRAARSAGNWIYPLCRTLSGYCMSVTRFCDPQSASWTIEPQQEIGPAPDQPLKIVDLCNRDGEEAMAEAVRLAEADAATPFDLERGPVMRSQLFRTSEQTNLLSLVLHHVAGDQWSMGVLGRELALLYNAALGGVQAKLPALPVSYQDYALWQRTGLAPEFERQLAFWRQKLAHLPPAELPTDRPRPRLPSLRGALCQIAFHPR